MVAQQEVGVSLLGRIVEAAGLKEAGADAPSLTRQISGYESGVRCVEVVSRRLSPAPVFHCFACRRDSVPLRICPQAGPDPRK